MKSKILSFSIALAASLALWLYVVTVVNQEVSNQPIDNISVTFSGADQIREDSNLVITAGADTTVDLRVTCSRTTLSKLSSENLSVVVDVTRIKKPGQYSYPYTVAYPQGVSSIDVNAYGTPREIEFTVERFIKKSVPVRGILNGSVAEGYYASALECTPREILLEGPEAVVNQVSYAQVILEQNELSETVIQSCPFALIDENGETVESEDIAATVDGLPIDAIELRQPVLPMKEVPLVVELIAGGGAKAEDVVWSCEPRTITISGDREILEKTNQIVVAQYDLAALMEPMTEDVPVTLPNDELINVADLSTVHVDVRINSNRLSTKTVEVTEFSVVNKPDGFDTNVLTIRIPVTIRGPIAAVERISAENVRAVIDASALNLGAQNVPVTIEITGSGGAAALGAYSAVITLERTPEPEDG
ncbi:MAG: hypothetical protein HFF17_08835 [Oscillospiraceae bacterium]|nr:hypothetical protein [Oscillospiraceae bacterium]